MRSAENLVKLYMKFYSLLKNEFMAKPLTKIVWLVLGVLVGAVGAYFYQSTPKQEGGGFYLSNQLNRQELLSLPIDSPTLRIMARNYSNDPMHFTFRYHPNASSAVVVQDVLQGFIFDTSSVRKLVQDTKCDRMYACFGESYNKINGPTGITIDTVFTIMLAGLKKVTDVSGTVSYAFSSGSGSDFADPCPPYCPKP